MSKDLPSPPSRPLLAAVPGSLPALTRALRLSAEAASVGFDWPDVRGVLDKVAEEAQELAEASDPGEIHHEFGDLLFALVNLGRFLDVDPEAALQSTNERFVLRFGHVEAGLHAQDKVFEDATLDEMEALWQGAKAMEKS